MSQQTITDKSNEIRNETQQYGNTRGRVADVIDDINDTKANREDLTLASETFDNALQQEIADRENGDATLADQISLEAEERQNADSAEAQARAAADNNLQTQISTEVTNRSNADSGLQSQITQNKNDIVGKVDKTTTTITAPDATFKYAYIFDEANNPRRMLAGDLGKNVANSSLTSVSGAGMTMGANWTLNTGGFYYNITNLPDKSADSTFSRMMTQNSSGQMAWSNGKQVIINMPATLTDAEKTTWKTAMNGGWTTNAMSIAIITPPIVDKQDKNYWLSLKGANLNLNPTNFSVQIMDSTGTNVVATVPNSHVQLYTNGIDLTFYYNFKDLPLGQYRIRLNNGVATMTTGATVTINVVQNLTIQDLSTTTWNVKTFNNYVSPVNVASGNSFGLSVDANIQALASNSTFIVSALSSNVIPANTNFYMECSITIATAIGGPDTTGGNVYFGITGASSSNMLSLLPFLFYRGYNYGIYQSNNAFRKPITEFFINSTAATDYNSNYGNGLQTQQITNKIIIQRVQNNYTILFINTTTNVVRTLNLTGTTDALKLVAQLQNHAYDSKISGNIEMLYLF